MSEPKLTPIDFEMCELMTVKEFMACVNAHAITRDDGIGYWATATHEDENMVCWNPPPVWATHVAWYNK